MLINLILFRLLSQKIQARHLILYCLFFYACPETAFSHPASVTIINMSNSGFDGRTFISATSDMPSVAVQPQENLVSEIFAIQETEKPDWNKFTLPATGLFWLQNPTCCNNASIERLKEGRRTRSYGAAREG